MDNETKNVSCKSPEGQKYQGEWRDDKPNGGGKMEFSNQDLYVGEWKDGLMDGEGLYRFYDPIKDEYVASYEGQFQEGKRHGIGRINFPDHTFYVGQWQADKRVGNGFAKFANGDAFQGLWKNDEMMRGIYALSNGDRYDGEMERGRFNGFGTYFFTDGKWYVGEWKDGAMTKGMVYWPDGRLKEIAEGKVVE